MKRLRVDISDEAEDDLHAIKLYIATQGAPEAADRLAEELIAHCEGLCAFPDRGAPRDDLARGVRTLVHERRTLIAYKVGEHAVTVLGFFYRGRDVEAAFRRRS
jgi:toxin ParE1/3/4